MRSVKLLYCTVLYCTVLYCTVLYFRWVLGGEDALLHAYPWVAVLKMRKELEVGGFFCGAAIINSRHGL